MTRVHRILRKRYAHKPLDGEGSYRFGGRWSSPGTRLAYTSEHMSLAMLEYFVHIDMDDAPRDLVMVGAEIPDSVSRVVMEPEHLPPDWWQTPAPPHLTVIGDSFAAQAEAAVLVLPSVLAPPERNWLINPLHPEFARIGVSPPEPFRYDVRFFG